MPLFKRKKITKPKSPLGSALFEYDNIFNKDLKSPSDALKNGKTLSPRRTNALMERTFYRLDFILEDLSKDNLKIDYRSDKIRYMIIDMIENIKNFFKGAKNNDFDPGNMEESDFKELAMSINIREEIKKKMKDIESDYI
ncbi:MAG: hypothetical protein JW770_04355 [Actinobacteria bacterium]|nr:hypothetical protein [Actinomycetota bacterium]